MSEKPGRLLWGIPGTVAETLEHKEKPVLTAWDLFALIRRSYRDAGREIPPPAELRRVVFVLKDRNIIRPDLDYPQHYRVVAVPNLPSDDIVCLLDRFCYISHLSAMQRWGLTDRIPEPLIISRPDDKTVSSMATSIMDKEDSETPWKYRPDRMPASSFHLHNLAHPRQVRNRTVKLHKSRHVGSSVRDRSGFARISTIGQTFLDMLLQPTLCGGMDHVLNVWDEHAVDHLSSIISTVNSAGSIIKCRAGYIIEERLGVSDQHV